MKKIIFGLSIVFCFLSTYAQNLTLNDLMILCSKKNWEEVHQILITKKWRFTKTETDRNFKDIVWEYNTSLTTKKDEDAYLRLYLYNEEIYAISLQTDNNLILNSTITAGFKFIDSEIKDNRLESTYANANFDLYIFTRSDRYSTAYEIEIGKKSRVELIKKKYGNED